MNFHENLKIKKSQNKMCVVINSIQHIPHLIKILAFLRGGGGSAYPWFGQSRFKKIARISWQKNCHF